MARTAKTAIVTGASRGIGGGLVEALLKRGDNVVANSRGITAANPFAAAANLAWFMETSAHPGTAAMIVDIAVSRFGQIDVLKNNAGVLIAKPFIEYTTDGLAMAAALIEKAFGIRAQASQFSSCV